MRHLMVVVILVNSLMCLGQIKSGEYAEGLKIAFNPSNKLITGFYENYYGFDAAGNPNHKYSCIFYLRGVYNDTITMLETYPTMEKDKDNIEGVISIIDSLHISIRLSGEHGFCGNVTPFAPAFVPFELSNKTNWLEIRYIDAAKSYFYKTAEEITKRKAYLLKGDIIYIDKIEKDWVHCKFIGKAVTEGWMKRSSINK